MADVSFTKKTWADGSSGGTPITASELNRMEQGIKDCADAANDLGDSISRKLWSGQWSSGSLEVSGVSEYTLLAITAVDSNDDATTILAVNSGTRVAGIGGGPLSSALSTAGFLANISGDNLSLVRCKTVSHNSSAAHGGVYNCSVIQIDGII